MNLTRARSLARRLMDDYHFQHWSFDFEDLSDAGLIGCCYPGKQLITLDLNTTMVSSEAQVLDTILHEIAHACCPRAGHGPKWKAMFRQILREQREGGPLLHGPNGEWRY